jgi:hypothetical protein
VLEHKHDDIPAPVDRAENFLGIEDDVVGKTLFVEVMRAERLSPHGPWDEKDVIPSCLRAPLPVRFVTKHKLASLA